MQEPNGPHSIHFEIAFKPKTTRDDTPKKALLATLILTLALIHTPFAQSRANVVHQVEEPNSNVHHIIKVDPKIEYQKTMIQRQKQRRPMPDPTPHEPELVQIAKEDLPDIDVAIFDDFTFSEDAFPGEPPARSSVIAQGTKGLEPPIITKRVPPNYPQRAARVGLQGYVILEAVMRSDGTLSDIRVLRSLGKGRFGFEDAARKALKKWEFMPGRLNGRNVDVRMTLKIDFDLSR